MWRPDLIPHPCPSPRGMGRSDRVGPGERRPGIWRLYFGPGGAGVSTGAVERMRTFDLNCL